MTCAETMVRSRRGFLGASLAAPLAAAGCDSFSGLLTAPADIEILEWSLARRGQALALTGRLRNLQPRNLRQVVVEAVFFDTDGTYLGSVTARTPGMSLPAGAVAQFEGVRPFDDRMHQPDMLFRQADGTRLVARMAADGRSSSA